MLTPTQLKQLCDQYYLRPSKSFGQNYLISDAPITAMIDAARITKDDVVIEVGPGFGILTLELAKRAKKVIAFEIEQKLRPYWEEKMKEYKNIEIVWGDALVHLDEHISKLKTYKVVANLPYQITSKLLRAFLERPHPPQSVTVMVQHEVAQRICAKPGSMSLLAVSVQYFGEPKTIKKVSKGNFWPSPKVDSAALLVDNIQTKKNSELFFKVVKAAFSQKRKQAWKLIAEECHIDGERVKSVLKEIKRNEKVRAEELSVGEWERMVEMFRKEKLV